MKITEKWLKDKNVCVQNLEHVVKNGYIGLELKRFIEKLVENKRFSDASWLITKSFSKRKNVEYAIFAAEQVIDIFESKYPEDKRSRKAINAAKEYLDNPCKETKTAADVAADVDAARKEMRIKILEFGLGLIN